MEISAGIDARPQLPENAAFWNRRGLQNVVRIRFTRQADKWVFGAVK